MPKIKSAVKAKKTALLKKPIKEKVIKKNLKTRPKPKKVQAIPKGHQSVTVYLIADKATRAIEFYKKAFGAKLRKKMNCPDGKIAHAELKIGDSNIMLADEFPEYGAVSPKSSGGASVTLHLYVKNVDKTVKLAVSAGAKIIRPVENAFYGDRCALVEDPAGYKWNVATHVEDVSPRELKKRAAKYLSENN